jgi:hypothetical protein
MMLLRRDELFLGSTAADSAYSHLSHDILSQGILSASPNKRAHYTFLFSLLLFVPVIKAETRVHPICF